MKIVLYGVPISKMRPRLTKGHVYDPQSKMKNLIKQRMQTLLHDQFEEDVKNTPNLLSAEAFCVNLIFYFQPSHSLSKVKRHAKLLNIEPCLVRKDLDNLEKFYLDCGNGLLYQDDHQIVKLSSQKLWAEQPRVEIEVKPFSLGNNEN